MKEGKRNGKHDMIVQFRHIHNIDMPGIGFKESFYFHFFFVTNKMHCDAPHCTHNTYCCRRRRRLPSDPPRPPRCLCCYSTLFVFPSIILFLFSFVGFLQLKHDNYVHSKRKTVASFVFIDSIRSIVAFAYFLTLNFLLEKVIINV